MADSTRWRELPLAKCYPPMAPTLVVTEYRAADGRVLHREARHGRREDMLTQSSIVEAFRLMGGRL